MNGAQELEALEQEIGDLDAKILDLVAQRQRLVERISRLRRVQGAPPRDIWQERRMLVSARKKARSLQIPTQAVESIAELLNRLAQQAPWSWERPATLRPTRGSGREL